MIMHNRWLFVWLFGWLSLSSACTAVGATPVPLAQNPGATPTSQPSARPNLNFDAETQALIEAARRVVFVIPFSHWDTDWHQDYEAYAKRADQNILKAIQLAQKYPRFRYTLEQTLFVQHFWDTYPQYRTDLKRLVQQRQLTFAWGGLTQPETSLVAPATQLHNLQRGRDWIADTFGPEALPRTAWQSDAFGNSAAFPLFLKQVGLPYLYIGRWQGRCDPDYDECEPLPYAFYWRSPVAPEDARVLAAYLSYPTGWAAIRRPAQPDTHLAALRKVIEAQFRRAESRYLILPLGFDFLDPMPNLPDLVERWNQADRETVLVMADADTAFDYLSTQELPEVTTDFNPVWQAYYASRPQAKIADKESEYYLTAADKFGLLLNVQPTAWQTATLNAHYDNIGAVSFDSVWEKTQRPRFEQTVAAAAQELADILTHLAAGVEAPLLVFNPTSWPRSEVIELQGDLPDLGLLPAPVQPLGPETVAIRLENIPPVGFAAPAARPVTLKNPAAVRQTQGQITLSNGLVSVTLDAAHGGALAGLAVLNSGRPVELLAGWGDDITYFSDTGDIYGARFGPVKARESELPARLTLLAPGPLLARAQAVFTVGGGQPVTKTVTLRAGSPVVEVTLDIAALPQTTVLVQTPTVLTAATRIDDLGLAAFAHAVDTRPVAPGDITYRRDIFYPIIYWSDVSRPDGSLGLSLLTHGLQGMAGAGQLALMLVRSVSGDEEGVTDLEYHTLRYAYLPHLGSAAQAQPWLAAYAFNQPLIPVWRSGFEDKLTVQLPFTNHLPSPRLPASPPPRFPTPFSLISAQSGLIADMYRRAGQVQALVIDYDPSTPAALHTGQQQMNLQGNWLQVVPVELAN